MIKINLNLLSPLKKKSLNGLVNFIFLRNLLEFAVLTITIIAIFLLWSWVTLVDQFNGLSQNTLAVTKEYSGYNQEIRMLNRINKDVILASQGYASTTAHVFDVIMSTPRDIVLSAINFERNAQRLTLSGIAQTRPALINYVEIIKNIPWLEQVITPTSQLFQKENIVFEIQAKTKIPPFKKNPAPSPAANQADSILLN